MSETAFLTKKTPSVLIIYTGGTIGMISNPATGAWMPFDFDKIREHVPELKRFKCSLESIAFKKPVDSSDIGFDFWKRLAKIFRKNHHKYDGFVVLHGTDTMSFTASMLSFMLENLNKPVILTGSQLPLQTLRTDGKENLITAIEIASAYEHGKPVVPEVCIYFENKLYRGNRTTKRNAEHFDAFESPNYPPLAEAGIHIHYNHNAIHYPRHSKMVRIHNQLDDNVAILKMFPGINKHVIKSVLNAHGLKAVVLETYGAGNTTTESWFIDILQKAIKKGIIILNVSQCLAGRVEMGRYDTSVKLQKIGVIGGADITTEAAVTKLMFLLGQNLSHKTLIQYLNTSFAGEIRLE